MNTSDSTLPSPERLNKVPLIGPDLFLMHPRKFSLATSSGRMAAIAVATVALGAIVVGAGSAQAGTQTHGRPHWHWSSGGAPTATATPTPSPSTSPSAGSTSGGTSPKVGVTSPSPTSTSTASTAARAYFSTSAALWNPIVAAPVLDPRNATVSAALSAPGNNRVLNVVAYGTPIFYADASTPRYSLTVTNAGTDKWGANDLSNQTVPIPADAAATSGTDGKLIIIDTSTRKVYDMWQAQKVGSGWTVSWGGVYPLDGDGSSHDVTYGSSAYQVAWPQPLTRGTGSGLSSLAGSILTSDVASGVINHALAFSTDIACSATIQPQRFPATASDGGSTNSSCLPEGSRIQLDPSLNLASIPGITPMELMVGKALQTYGAYVSDQGGARIAFNVQTPSNAAAEAEYASVGAAGDYVGLGHLPWTHIRVLKSWNGQ
jgi:hypothetical protein